MSFSSSTTGSVPYSVSDSVSDKRIVFVSGKGGVGKSLIAAAIASEQAEKGRRVLLAEIGETSYYQDFWGLPSVGHDPVSTEHGFDLALWSGESCLREYVLFYLRMERLYKLFFENKVMRALVNVAPGLSEIAILGKITSGLRKVGPPLDYDLIVVDCYASGHAMALFNSPRGMMEAIKFGPMGTHSREMEAVIRNPGLCSYFIVTLLEELPVTESIEFAQTIRREIGVEPVTIANKVLDLPVDVPSLRVIEEAQPKGLGEFARFLRATFERQSKFSEQLAQEFASRGSPMLRIPLIFSNDARELTRGVKESIRKP